MDLPYDPAILLLAIYPKELEAGSPRNICVPMFIEVLVIMAKRWKQPKLPWRDERTNTVYPHDGILFSRKRKDILRHAMCMNLEDVM